MESVVALFSFMSSKPLDSPKIRLPTFTSPQRNEEVLVGGLGYANRSQRSSPSMRLAGMLDLSVSHPSRVLHHDFGGSHRFWVGLQILVETP